MSDSKVYKNPDEIIDLLKNKNLKFSQPQRAKRLLLENNFYVIKAYRKLFYDNSRMYKDNVDFEHLYAVYSFDKELKTTILKHLLFIEQKIKTAISNQISPKYGIKEEDYLNHDNFDQNNQYIEKVVNEINNQIEKYGEKNQSVSHYKNNYGFIPFWVLSKCLTMGVVRDFYNILKPKDKDEIAKNLLTKQVNNRGRKINTLIALITDVRNMCAYDEVLLGFVHNRIDIGNYEEQNLISCKRNNNGVLLQGRKDILALFIAVKYLVNRTMYNEFIQQIKSLINKCYKKIKDVVTLEEFLGFIGLPVDYESLKEIE